MNSEASGPHNGKSPNNGEQPGSSRASAPHLRHSLAPLSSLRGYRLSFLPHDLAAGVVTAALAIPIAMGYAQIAGMPASYGILASAVTPLAFALVTATRRIAFGMAAATAAITGSLLEGIGYLPGSEELVAVMPSFTILTSAFLLLFALFHVGKLVRLIPVPVTNGFVTGISLSVIVSQIPLFTGTNAVSQGGFFEKLAAIVTVLPQTNLPTLAIGLLSILALLALRKRFPKAPGALLVLVTATALSALLDLEPKGVEVLGDIAIVLPSSLFPQVALYQIGRLLPCSLVTAFIVAFEGLLCVESFSIREGIRTKGDRELVSFGIANFAGGLLGCPPCSATVSRTAALVDANGESQVAGIVSSAVVALVGVLFAPLIHTLPRACLSAIIVVALAGLVNGRVIARYAQHMRPELGVFCVTAGTVLVFGTLPGVIAGVIISLCVASFRRRRFSRRDGANAHSACVDMPADCSLFALDGSIDFTNIDRRIDEMLARMQKGTRAVVLDISESSPIDTTATVKLLQMADMLRTRGIEVATVGGNRTDSDRYTEYEASTIMGYTKAFPDLDTALRYLKTPPKIAVQ